MEQAGLRGPSMSTLPSVQVPVEASIVNATKALTGTLRHSALVRVTHWVITLSFFALVLSGGEIIVSHPRFYWGETGNVLTKSLFKIPIPASRNLVPTGYGYALPDQNGWSRALHFQSAWILVGMGLLYVVGGILSRAFAKRIAAGQERPLMAEPGGSDRPSFAD